jgi:hypothetical protein
MLHELFSKILEATCATLSVEYTVKRTPSKSCMKSSSDHLWGEITLDHANESLVSLIPFGADHPIDQSEWGISSSVR